MTLPQSLADVLDVGPSPADPPEAAEDWSLLDELATAVAALTEKLRAERERPRWNFAADNFCI